MIGYIVTRIFSIGVYQFAVGDTISDPTLVALIAQEPAYRANTVPTQVDASSATYPVVLSPIELETIRAKAAETAGLAATVAEAARATQAETTLANAIQANSTAIQAEATRAVAAEALAAPLSKIGAALGLAPLDANAALPLANLQLRTAPFLTALQSNLPGGWAGFAGYAAIGASPADPLFAAIFLDAFVTSTLTGAVLAYLQAPTAGGGLGQTSSQAAATLASLVTAAAGVTTQAVAQGQVSVLPLAGAADAQAGTSGALLMTPAQTFVAIRSFIAPITDQLAAIQSTLLPSGTFTLDFNQSGNFF